MVISEPPDKELTMHHENRGPAVVKKISSLPYPGRDCPGTKRRISKSCAV
jgi:hypothetical protein